MNETRRDAAVRALQALRVLIPLIEVPEGTTRTTAMLMNDIIKVVNTFAKDAGVDSYQFVGDTAPRRSVL